MTTHFQHLDPNIFINPHKFDPHRWIREGERQRLEKYVVPFSKGSRACIGLQWVPPITYISPRLAFSAVCSTC